MQGSIPEFRVVILGAGPGVRNDLPSALMPVGNHGRLLDWLLAAFGHLPGLQVDFVSGFMADQVMPHYSNIDFHYNSDWRSTGPVRSLAVSPLRSQLGTFICYSDVVFRSDTVRRIQEVDADVVVGVDRKWMVRYDGRSASEMESAEKVRVAGGVLTDVGREISESEADGEFAGLVKLSARTAERLENVIGSTLFKDHDGLPEVLTFLIQHDTEARVVDVAGEWAELNAPQDLARFVLGTKAESLERLRPLLKSGHIGDLLRVEHKRWLGDPEEVMSRVRSLFGDALVIVRSSSMTEDGWQQSSAGAFKSIPDVDPGDAVQLRAAIEEVYASYDTDLAENQILVQHMLAAVRMSGVVMTRTHSSGAPYLVVSYDDTTSRTDTVTSGTAGEIKTLFLHRGERLRPDSAPELTRVLDVVHEVEHLVGHDSLDIEFAVAGDGQVHVLQVRPIAVTYDNVSSYDSVVNTGLRHAQAYFQELQNPSPPVIGDHTLLSVMSDWNPAEIIGCKPGRLAFSLYRYLITDDTWARQRAQYGYRDVRPCNLLVDILGHPYIDVRACFNSFIPAALEDGLTRRLVEHQLKHLAASPELHDKVEFDILSTCWTFDIDERLQRLAEAGFDETERGALADSLLDITRRGIERCGADHDSLEAVVERYQVVVGAKVAPLRKAYLHLENATRHGALHFAHLARGAFVATTLLRSMVTVGVLEVEELESFLGSLSTISSAIQLDGRKVACGDMNWKEFVDKYGHLRPGTYDINSSRYDSAPEEFLRPIVEQANTGAVSPQIYEWGAATKQRVESALTSSGLGVGFRQFEEFLRLSIEGREYGKFVFTRDLSAALECFGDFGAAHFTSREELSRIAVHDLLGFLAADAESPSVTLHELARRGLDSHHVQQTVCLPDQILTAADISCFEVRRVTPNYVTRKKVRARIVSIDQTSSPDLDLAGMIVLIPNADPGFDWIFTRNIAGLITMYGGANSHMAVRMAEFQLPGATGVGELLFADLCAAHTVELDCAGRQLRLIGSA